MEKIIKNHWKTLNKRKIMFINGSLNIEKKSVLFLLLGRQEEKKKKQVASLLLI